MNKTINKELIIIGGGPAGLKAAQEAAGYGLDYIILEKGKIGQAWRDIRPQMSMLSPCHPQRDWTSLDQRFPIWKLDVQRPYCTAGEFSSYLQAFADFYRLNIQEDCRVISVDFDGHRFFAEDKEKNEYSAPFLLLANGIFNNPFIPDIPGLNTNKNFIHSHFYKGPELFRGKRVLVVGAGNSAAEIAVELSGYSMVYLASRDRLKFFSETNRLYHIRGIYESYLRELIRMEIIRLLEQKEITQLKENRVFFGAEQLRVDKIIFATGYRPDHSIFHKLRTDRNKKFSLFKTADSSAAGFQGLYFAGANIAQPKSVVTIHSFIKYIPGLIEEIYYKLQTSD